MNDCKFVGRLTRDPEVKHFGSGKKVVLFSLAVAQTFNPKESDFFDFKVFGKTAEFVETYFKKGKVVWVSSSAKLEKWDSQGGEKRSKMMFYVDRVGFVPSSSADKPETADAGGVEELNKEDIPF